MPCRGLLFALAVKMLLHQRPAERCSAGTGEAHSHVSLSQRDLSHSYRTFFEDFFYRRDRGF